jgi:AcrR family transcriptional regulator
MAAVVGLRERKKQRTRQALIDAAVRLFEERGYEATTVADIAAAAEVTPRTFFLHFPAKEAVVFANSPSRLELGLGILASRHPGEPVRDLLVRAMTEMIQDTWESDLASGLGVLRVRLLMTSPALRASLFTGLFAAQGELAAVLRSVYPDELDDIDAAALVGALVGAVYAAVLGSVQRGDSATKLRDAMLRATELGAPCSVGVSCFQGLGRGR